MIDEGDRLARAGHYVLGLMDDEEREREVEVTRQAEADDGEREDGHREQHRATGTQEGRTVGEE